METGRNDPCPCGSEKKYKKCCLIQAYTETGREDAVSNKVVQDLLGFFRKNYQHALDDAYAIFWDEFNLEERFEDIPINIAEINFWDWIVHDFVVDVENDKTLIDLYMENNRRMSLDEHKVLRLMKNSIISLYEVQEVLPEKGLLLKDLLLGGEYDVHEKAATRTLGKWDIYAARLIYIDGKYSMSGSAYPYPVKQKERILEDIYFEFEDYRQEYPEEDMDDFLKRNSEIFNFYWYDLIQNPAPMILHTTTGEPMIISKAIFEIKDKETVRNGLTNIKGFEKQGEDFIWLAKKNKEGSATILGRTEIKAGKLILECNSKTRLEDGKKLIIKELSDVLNHKIDTFQDTMEALKEYKKKPHKESATPIPLEIQQQMYTKFMQKHSEEWLKKKIPVLNGKTPMQAIKTKEGRRKVIELLKSFENSQEHNKKEGRPFYDTSWMWERLGLERED